MRQTECIGNSRSKYMRGRRKGTIMEFLKCGFSSGILLGFVAASVFCGCGKRSFDEDYEPSQDFQAAFEAMGAGAQRDVATTGDRRKQPVEDLVDLERTVQLMRGIELAQEKCDDWMSFLELLAKFDYTGVPRELIDSQKMLLPIMERLKAASEECKNSSKWWSVFKAMCHGGLATFEKIDVDAMKNANVINNQNRDAVAAGIRQGMKAYEVSEDQRKSLEIELRKVQESYLEYLRTYSPLRRKYQKEWDSFCLIKDRAYLEVYRKQYDDAIQTTEDALKKSINNRDICILRARALMAQCLDQCEQTNGMPVIAAEDVRVKEVVDLLDRCIEQNPGTSAPAIVLKGMVECMTGDVKRAIITLNHAAMEYPRQAKELTDVFEAYASRPHLEDTAEGLCLLRLHRAVYEGNGIFSPNLEKALVYERTGMCELADEEIYNHFFRRGRQTELHGLFTDVDFCDKYLSAGRKNFYKEHSLIELNFGGEDEGNDKEKGFAWELMWSDGVPFTLANRTDEDLYNIRVFLCVQYSEMYHGEYDVIKGAVFGRLNAGVTHEGSFRVARKGKGFGDVVKIRAIVMTDDKIFWADSMREKYKAVKRALSSGLRQQQVNEYLSERSLDQEQVLKLLRSANCVYDAGFFTDDIVLNISRKLATIDPIFSADWQNDSGVLFPSKVAARGSGLRVSFLNLVYGISEGGRLVINMHCPCGHYLVVFRRKPNAKEMMLEYAGTATGYEEWRNSDEGKRRECPQPPVKQTPDKGVSEDRAMHDALKSATGSARNAANVVAKGADDANAASAAVVQAERASAQASDSVSAAASEAARVVEKAAKAADETLRKFLK